MLDLAHIDMSKLKTDTKYYKEQFEWKEVQLEREKDNAAWLKEEIEWKQVELKQWEDWWYAEGMATMNSFWCSPPFGSYGWQ